MATKTLTPTTRPTTKPGTRLEYHLDWYKDRKRYQLSLNAYSYEPNDVGSFEGQSCFPFDMVSLPLAEDTRYSAKRHEQLQDCLRGIGGDGPSVQPGQTIRDVQQALLDTWCADNLKPACDECGAICVWDGKAWNDETGRNVCQGATAHVCTAKYEFVVLPECHIARVVISADGHAVNLERAKQELPNLRLHSLFERNDGWSLATPKEFIGVARRLWDQDWVRVYRWHRGAWLLTENLTPREQPERPRQPFDEAECGGAFDGTRVISDADPGL